MRVAELRIPCGDNAGRPFKLQRVGKRIRIGESAPGLPGQEILVLPVKLAQAYRVPVVVAEKVKLEIDLYFVFAVIRVPCRVSQVNRVGRIETVEFSECGVGDEGKLDGTYAP